MKKTDKKEIQRSLVLLFLCEDGAGVFRILPLLLDEEEHVDHVDRFQSNFSNDYEACPVVYFVREQEVV